MALGPILKELLEGIVVGQVPSGWDAGLCLFPHFSSFGRTGRSLTGGVVACLVDERVNVLRMGCWDTGAGAGAKLVPCFLSSLGLLPELFTERLQSSNLTLGYRVA
jgi:hypothetical protein